MDASSFEHRRKAFKTGLDEAKARKSRLNATEMLRKKNKEAALAKKRRPDSTHKDLEGVDTKTSSDSSSSSLCVMTPTAFIANLPTIARMLLEACTALNAKDTLETQREVIKALILVRKGVSCHDENFYHPILSQGPPLMDAIYSCAASPHIRISYEALWILTNVAATPATKFIVAKDGFVHFLMHTCLILPTSPAIRSMTIWLLANIGADDETRHYLTADPAAIDLKAGPPAHNDPRQWSSSILGPRLSATAKDLIERHDSDNLLDPTDLEHVGWLLFTLARPSDRRIVPTQAHFEWYLSQIFPIVEMMMFKQNSDKSVTMRSDMKPAVYNELFKVVHFMTNEEDDRAMTLLVNRPIWMVATIHWIQRCLADGHFDLMTDAIKITGNLLNGSSEMAKPMVEAGIIQLYFLILDHPHCSSSCKKEVAYGLSNLAIDDVHHMHLYTPDYIQRAVRHWSTGSFEVRREFSWFFFNILQSHSLRAGPIFELLSPTAFYDVLKEVLQKQFHQTTMSLCMRICKSLFELGYGYDLCIHGIDTIILDELSTFPFAKGEDSALVSELVTYCEAEGKEGDE